MRTNDIDCVDSLSEFQYRALTTVNQRLLYPDVWSYSPVDVRCTCHWIGRDSNHQTHGLDMSN